MDKETFGTCSCDLLLLVVPVNEVDGSEWRHVKHSNWSEVFIEEYELEM